jgi:hydroxymethylpyrimidine pyrophosphatase-like HAD family hydrolase
LEFYQDYAWCLNPFPTVQETVAYLSREIDRLQQPREPWQTGEIMTNVYLLSGALLNAVEEYLRGRTLRVPRTLAARRFFREIRWAAERLGSIVRQPRRARVRRWRENWQAQVDVFLTLLIAEGTPDPMALADAGNGLVRLLQTPLPSDLQAEPIYFPSAFRTLDLTHFDVLALGRRFVTRFPERCQPILLLGLRTAGSYFAPLLRALLKAEGFRTVATVTVHPVKGPGAWERAELTRCAQEGYLAVVLDDPPHTGDTIVVAVDMARQAGFAPSKVVALVPTHPARRDWSRSLSVSDTGILTLEPEEWHKQRLLDPKVTESRVTEYFQRRSFPSACVVASTAAEEWNARLPARSEDPRRSRLKRIYEVRLQTPEGEVETRYVLAKSVGWGWLGYHAFLAGHRLTGFVPPVLGLRDGILYMEWLPQPPPRDQEDREQWIQMSASYVAARVRSLSLGKNPLPNLGLHRHHDGFRLLEKVLSRAYGRFLTAGLMRPRVRQRLASQPCPLPTLIDGKMQRGEWIAGPHGLLKTDYEHHGMGKNELNAIDPAYDLANAIMQMALSPEEEGRLIRHYVAESGDAEVESRLFLNKLLAGSWAMTSALKSLFQHSPHSCPAPAEERGGKGRQEELHEQFVRALHFLTIHAARFGGGYCRPPTNPRWGSPLVVLDIDGVLDRRIFGFPCTTAAGIQALALLHAHEFAIAVDTARSVAEVTEYCRAYGFVGGVAEYGSYLWDATSQRGRVLVSPESLRQLEQARKALEQLPGVFLDDRYQYSIRAWTYEDQATVLSRVPIPGPLRPLLAMTADDKAPTPLPTLIVKQLLASLGLDQLSCRQTTLDTTIVAQEVDKGRGLLALLNWVGQPDVETMAIGDSEPDLAMFRAARQCFAPAQISCGRLARLLGCRIARQPFQRGLLTIVRSLVHPDGRRCPRCASCAPSWSKGQDLVLDLLQAADQQRPAALFRVLLDPRAYRMLVR